MLKNKLFQRWTVANALAELFGLGLAFVITGMVFSKLDSQQTVITILLSFVFAVLSGAVEATVVGLAQWWAMHPWFPLVSCFAWWRGTLIGALIAYVLGYLPSTLMSMGETTTQSAPVQEPAQWIILLLAAGMGAVDGRCCLCAVADSAGCGQGGRHPDPCQHAGLGCRDAGHLLGRGYGFQDD